MPAKKTTKRSNAMPAAADNAKLKPYTVAPGFIIGDNNSERCVGGDEIMLTAAQAKFLNARGALALSLPDEDDEDDDDSTANDSGASAAAKPAETVVEGESIAGGTAAPKVSATKRKL